MVAGTMVRGSSSAMMNWLGCQARTLYNTTMVVVGLMLMLVALGSFFHVVVVQDLTQDLLQASRSALGLQIAHHGSKLRRFGRRMPSHDAKWVTRVKHSGTPNKSGGYSVLVTGAAGFIGSSSALAMTMKGWGVVGLDNFHARHDPARDLKLEREKLLHNKGRIFVVHGDTNDEKLIEALFEIVPFTHVLHLAAQAGVRYPELQDSPLSFVRSDVSGLVNLLEVCARANPQPTFVWASSSSVYGLNNRIPFSESDRTDEPVSLYAATKKAGEEIVHVYNHLYGLSVTTLRFFTVYGPYGRPDMAIFNFTESILSRKPINIYLRGGGGREGEGPRNSSTVVARDFTYIDDIVNGIMAAVETAGKSTGVQDDGSSSSSSKSTRHSRQPAEFRVVNLGSNQPVAVEDMVSLLETSLGMTAIRRYETMAEEGTGDVPCTTANLTLAEKHLGYHPRTSLTNGLKKFVLWYLKYTDRDQNSSQEISS